MRRQSSKLSAHFILHSASYSCSNLFSSTNDFLQVELYHCGPRVYFNYLHQARRFRNSLQATTEGEQKAEYKLESEKREGNEY